MFSLNVMKGLVMKPRDPATEISGYNLYFLIFIHQLFYLLFCPVMMCPAPHFHKFYLKKNLLCKAT